MKVFALRLMIADFAIINAAAAIIAVSASLFGRDIISTFVYVTFLFSGFLLIAGGYLGFFASSTSLNRLYSMLRLKRGNNSSSRSSREHKEKPEKRGLRAVILGIALLFESMTFALLLT